LGILEDVTDHESSKPDEREKLAPDPGQEHGFGDLQFYVPQDLLDVSFPVTVRGYDRRAVDAYIKRVNRVIAELKVRSSPPAAVRHALEQAEAKGQGLLQAAREAAEQITASAQQEAEENTARAKAEAAELTVNTSAEADRVKAEADALMANARTEAGATADKAKSEADALIANARTEADNTAAKAKSEADERLASASAEAQSTLARAQAEADERLQRLQEELAALREAAETRMRQLQADTEAVWQERHELLEDIRRLSGGLVEVANAAASRIPRGETAAETEIMEPEAGAEERAAEGAREDVAERTASGPHT
jgi:DivIVA domain-containing protein